MSLLGVALKSAVRRGILVARCGHCGLTLTPEDYRARKCPMASLESPCPEGKGFDPTYTVPS